MMFSFFFSINVSRKWLWFTIFEPHWTSTIIFLKRFIPGFTNVVQNFIWNNLVSSCNGDFHRNTCQSGPCPATIMLTTFVLEAKENLLTWFRICISWLFCNQEEIGCGRKGYCCGTSLCVSTIMTSYTKKCTRTRRDCWCKFGWNLTRSFCAICNLVSLSLMQRQGLSIDFTCLFI